eukprot:Gb_07914 [translate_table: standard]
MILMISLFKSVKFCSIVETRSLTIAEYHGHAYPHVSKQPWNQKKTTTIILMSCVYQSSGMVNITTNVVALKQETQQKRNNQPEGNLPFNGRNRGLVSSNAMLTWYTKNGRINSARMLFDEMSDRTAVSWNIMITGYTRNGMPDDARRLFDEMPERNIVSWNGMIAGYARNGMIKDARLLFDKMPERNVVSWTAMLTGYIQEGRIEDARVLFDEMPERNVVSWTAMMAGYIQDGKIENARQLFDQMPVRDVVTWSAMVTGYAQHGQIENARNLFDKMPVRNVVSWTAMISGYAQNGKIEDAQELFNQMPERNEVSWTAMITGYAQNGRLAEARRLFDKMPQKSMISQNAMITGYAQNGRIEDARQLFERLSERNVVSWTAMVVGYAQNRRIEEAHQLFEKMPEKTIVSWTAMIKGYTQSGYDDEALRLFSQMQRAGIKPDKSTFISILSACANLAALKQGKQVHQHLIKMRFECDVFVVSTLITMYVKCGTIDNALHAFDKAPERDVVLWNAMIAGYAQHGYGEEALQLFKQMQESGMKPDGITFVGVLSACRHTGLVDEGWLYFDSMSREYCITPRAEHYACMVDLLGRFGFLAEAENLINTMPFEPDAVVWGALLGACRIHLNLELAECAAEHLFELEPQNPGTYVLLSNIYAAAGKWDDVAKVRKMMKDKGIKKVPGCSWIEVNNKVYAFLGGDRSHSQTEKIYAMLERLAGRMVAAGYVPDTNFVLRDVDEEQKKHILFHHSEKLAIAYGIISIPLGTPIRIIKNLRVCGDCHTAIKFISKIIEREIVVRDANRFHHFKDGFCSCGDYW